MDAVKRPLNRQAGGVDRQVWMADDRTAKHCSRLSAQHLNADARPRPLSKAEYSKRPHLACNAQRQEDLIEEIKGILLADGMLIEEYTMEHLGKAAAPG